MAERRRLEIDSVLRCLDCGSAPYRVFRRQLAQPDGTLLVSFESVLWPTRPEVPPPTNPEKITCPDCGDPLVRVAP